MTSHATFRSMRQNFNRTTRRAFFIIGSGLMMTGTSFRGGDTTITETALPQIMVEQSYLLSDDEKEQINHRLIMNALKSYPAIADEARTSYSVYLDSLETTLQRTGTRSVIMDPNTIDVGDALGFPREIIFTKILSAAGISPVKDFVDAFTRSSLEDFLLENRYPNPGALSDVNDDGILQATFMPLSDLNTNPAFDIAGMTKTTAEKVINTHEKWHIQSSAYRVNSQDRLRLQKAAEIGTDALMKDPELLNLFSRVHREETFADVGSVGDLIRAGADMTIIDLLSDKRLNRDDPSFTLMYISAPTLHALKEAIQTMGIKNFKKISNDDIAGFYTGLVNEYAMSGDNFKTLYQYLEGDMDTRMALQRDALTNKQTEKVLDFHTYLTQNALRENKQDTFTPILTDQEKDIIATYHPLQDMIDTAFAREGKITPKSLLKAYGQMQENLRQSELKHPDNRIYAKQRGLLRDALVQNLSRLDYAGLNQACGLPKSQIKTVFLSN